MRNSPPKDCEQMTAERIKRATILESEGKQAAAVNEAEGTARATVVEAGTGAGVVNSGALTEPPWNL